MNTFSPNGLEYVLMATCAMLVILILVSKLVNRRKPRRHDLQKLALTHLEYLRRKQMESSRRDL